MRFEDKGYLDEGREAKQRGGAGKGDFGSNGEEKKGGDGVTRLWRSWGRTHNRRI